MGYDSTPSERHRRFARHADRPVRRASRIGADSRVGMMTWYPDGYICKDGVRCCGLALASRAGINLIRAFVFHR